MLNPSVARDLSTLYHTLARLWSAGLPPLQAGLSLEPQAFRGVARCVAALMAEALRAGRPLSSAATAAGAALPVHHAPVLLAGEQSGTIVAVLEALARGCATEADALARLWAGLARPMVLWVAAAAILPLPRLVLGGVGAYLVVAVPPLLVLAGALLLVRHLAATAREGSAATAALAERVPGIADLWRLASRARICRAFALLQGAGLPLPATLRMAARAAGPGSLRTAMLHVAKDVERGRGVVESLRERRALDGLALQLAAEGEATGRFDAALGHAADELDGELQRRLRARLSVLGGLVYGTVLIFLAWRIVAAWPTPPAL